VAAGRSPGHAPRPCEEMPGGARRTEGGHAHEEGELDEGHGLGAGGGGGEGDGELFDPDSLTYIVSDAPPPASCPFCFSLSLGGLDWMADELMVPWRNRLADSRGGGFAASSVLAT
jgi:hypothetical protein